jgi:hypothetical protein
LVAMAPCSWVAKVPPAGLVLAGAVAVAVAVLAVTGGLNAVWSCEIRASVVSRDTAR